MKTDVAGAISGYYKQIYLATYELVNVTENDTSVGIECGADIRIFRKSKPIKSIEVKFYNKDLGLYSLEIAKTIHNFYWQSYSDMKLVFQSNTKAPEEMFGGYRLTSAKQKENYIIHLLIKYAISNQKNRTEIRNYFEKIGTQCGRCKTNCCDECIEKFIKSKRSEIQECLTHVIKVNMNVNLDLFASKVHFEFENKNKLASITEIKKQVKMSLTRNFMEQTSDLSETILNSIIHKIAMSFFDTAVVNSIIHDKINDTFVHHKKLTRIDVIHFINDFHQFLNEFKEDVLENTLVDIMKKENLDQEKILFSYDKEFQDFIVSKKYVKDFNELSLKEYFHNMQIKFTSIENGNSLINRFMKYQKGFGLIAYLISLDLIEIRIFKEKLFVKTEVDTLYIKNNGYYEYNLLSQYIGANKESENNFYRYLWEDNISYLECTYLIIAQLHP